MNVPLIIGKTSDNNDVSVNLATLPNLFISYSSDEQLNGAIHFFYSQLVSLSDIPLQVWEIGELYTNEYNKPELKHTISLLYKQHLRRLKLVERTGCNTILTYNENEKKANRQPFIIAIIKDIFKIITSRNKKEGIKFIEMLLRGADTGISFIAASENSYRNILLQLIALHPKIEERIASIAGPDRIKIKRPLGAEMIITFDNLVFFMDKDASAHERFYFPFLASQ